MSKGFERVEREVNRLLETMFYVVFEELSLEKNFPDAMQDVPMDEIMQVCRDIALTFDGLNSDTEWGVDGRDYFDEVSRFARKMLRSKLSLSVSFFGDSDKMYDFAKMSRKEFLASYSYLTEADYEATLTEMQDLIRRNANPT